jgi:hypothetical protein
MMTKKLIPMGAVMTCMLLLSGCTSFSGLRTPKYDGRPFETQPEKIAAFEESNEIIGEEKNLYISEPFSPDIHDASLDYVANEPILLEEGSYIIGQDIPAGRVTLIGEKDDPSHDITAFRDPSAPPSPEEYNVGTMTIRDEEDMFYFENMFHPYYGVQIAQVDFIAGHTIELYGSEPEIVVFYQDKLPENPYVFDTRWEDYLADLEEQGYELVEAGEDGGENEEEDDFEAAATPPQEQPLSISEDGNVVELKAGIYEVGNHFDAGTYEITFQSAPSYTELYLFRADEEPRIFDISENLYGISLGWQEFNQGPAEDADYPVIELLPGDKIYPHYVNQIQLTKID